MAIPTQSVAFDFQANPTATFADILSNADDVVSFWRMNSASTLLDERNNNDGVIVGTPTLDTDPFPYDIDQALAFDGSADSAYVPSATSLTSKGNFTIEGWIKLPSWPASTKDG